MVFDAAFSGTTYFRDAIESAQRKESYSGALLEKLGRSNDLAQCAYSTRPREANAVVLFDDAPTAYCVGLEVSWVGEAIVAAGDFFFGPEDLGFSAIELVTAASDNESNARLPVDITVKTTQGECTGSGTWNISNLLYPPTGTGLGRIG